MKKSDKDDLEETCPGVFFVVIFPWSRSSAFNSSWERKLSIG
jgi:hypothetical protein